MSNVKVKRFYSNKIYYMIIDAMEINVKIINNYVLMVIFVIYFNNNTDARLSRFAFFFRNYLTLKVADSTKSKGRNVVFSDCFRFYSFYKTKFVVN